VGGLIGNVPGAIIGAALEINRGRPGLPLTKMRNVVNARVDKTSMKKTGKAKVKKRSVVKVSPYLRKAIKQVNQGETATGLYKRSFTGLVGNIPHYDTVDLNLGTFQMLTANSAVYMGASRTKFPGHKTWFTQLVSGQAAQPVTVSPHMDLNFFTPTKFWHAASVLFNRRVERDDVYALKDKMLASVSIGGEQTATASNVKIEIVKSYMEMTIKNLSARTLFVDIYECVSLMKFNSKNPLQDLQAQFTNLQDNATGTQDNLIQYWQAGTKLGPSLSLLTDPNVDQPALMKANGWKWKYEKRTMFLAPGEICQHTVSGPSGVLDLQKTWDPQSLTYKTDNAMKDFSKHLMISVRADPILRTIGVNHGLSYTPVNNNQANEMFSFISINCNEVMSIKVPEIAGFALDTTPVLGDGQTLNLRKKRYCFSTLNNALGDVALNDLFATSEFTPTQGTSAAVLQ